MGCLSLATWAVGAALAAAPAETVPVATQAALLLKVLEADRNLRPRDRADLVIGIVYQRSSRASRDVAERFAAEVERATERDGALRARSGLIDVSAPGALAEGVAALDPGALYVAPLEGFDVGRIVALSRSLKIRTATGVPAFVEDGLAVGFESDRGAPRIVINREASRAEGADFSSKLLKLARPVP
jgi:YfiR/HmsC-like